MKQKSWSTVKDGSKPWTHLNEEQKKEILRRKREKDLSLTKIGLSKEKKRLFCLNKRLSKATFALVIPKKLYQLAILETGFGSQLSLKKLLDDILTAVTGA